MGWAQRINKTAQDAKAGVVKPKPEKPILITGRTIGFGHGGRRKSTLVKILLDSK
jgi:hypothetical protein